MRVADVASIAIALCVSSLLLAPVAAAETSASAPAETVVAQAEGTRPSGPEPRYQPREPAEPDAYNDAWWELRERYQGVAPPVERGADAFDPGAKYHVPANTPYTRYFLAHILQFQFQRALCDLAGHEGELQACSVYNSKEAGEKFWTMMQAGSSQPWQDTLEMLTGTREMDATAIIDYFQPLMGYLKEQNEGRSCGW